MSSFRLLLAIAAELGLDVYGGDINTAYLSALLSIRQYLRSINGYPCKVNGHVIEPVVPGPWLPKVFDGTLPLLRFGQGTIVYVLVYVDDILVATNDEQYKNSLFAELNEAYGIKDQGLLSQYLGVEVKQTAEQITISQGKYAREILSKYGYENAHAVGNPMEVNVRLTSLEKPETADTGFPYREAIGMLMYLATSTRPDLAFAVGQLS
ncbi:hypothetical protein PC123_g366 [Phytophthora cactorum]|nr:hypothetical protein PC120_g596 [Phytophthora cactorum]KAG4064799.1 hypothetical protein PC123_g366 [Phytophthora cactorum]